MTISDATINDNGGWCWYQDERTWLDAEAGIVLLGSVASDRGRDGDRRGGDIDLTVVDLATGTPTRVTLHPGLEADDHNVPALWKRADGRWLAVYTRHGTDALTRWRISEPGDPTSWGPEQVFDWSRELTDPRDAEVAARQLKGVTYQNIHRLDGVLHCFVRAVNLDPCCLISHDDGDTWQFGGRLLTREGKAQSYARYASGTHHGSDDRLDLVITERHPRVFETSIWHGYISGGRLHRTDGTVIGELGGRLDQETPAVEDLTRVIPHGSTWSGSRITHLWTIDLRRGADGTLVGIFSGRVDDPFGLDHEDRGGAPTPHRFFRGVLAAGSSEWQVKELAEAGPELYTAEQDYTGLVSIDPDDLDCLYLSSPIDPRDGADLPHHAVFHGRTADAGDTWDWTVISAPEDRMALRPIAIPGDPRRSAVAWLRGTFETYCLYDLEVVLRVGPREHREG